LAQHCYRLAQRQWSSVSSSITCGRRCVQKSTSAYV